MYRLILILMNFIMICQYISASPLNLSAAYLSWTYAAIACNQAQTVRSIFSTQAILSTKLNFQSNYPSLENPATRRTPKSALRAAFAFNSLCCIPQVKTYEFSVQMIGVQSNFWDVPIACYFPGAVTLKLWTLTVQKHPRKLPVV